MSNTNTAATLRGNRTMHFVAKAGQNLWDAVLALYWATDTADGAAERGEAPPNGIELDQLCASYDAACLAYARIVGVKHAIGVFDAWQRTLPARKRSAVNPFEELDYDTRDMEAS